jgi:hypothetical protein
MRSNTKSKPPRRSVQRAACGYRVGRRAWLRSACHTLRRERRRAEVINQLSEPWDREAGG